MRASPTLVCFNAIVLASMGSKDPAQMCLAQDDDLIQTLAPDRVICQMASLDRGVPSLHVRC
jgi:hypothetical protein